MSLINRLHPSNLAARIERTVFRTSRALGVMHLVLPGHASFLDFCKLTARSSTSQIGQDLFVLWVLGMKRGGYFVEVGAASGVALSNSCLLERSFGWHGICAEPGRGWHAQLHAERSCIIDERCVWSESGARLDFMECAAAEFSTLASFAASDGHRRIGHEGGPYTVESVSLTDLLTQHHAPKVVDYLSIDTEGSELEILKAHDFTRFQFRVITVEHNKLAGRRAALSSLLTGAGYRRLMPSLSAFDDWYVHESVFMSAP